MITPTQFTVPLDLVRSLDVLGDCPGKIAINEPTGDFFYDAWTIKPEFKDTGFDKVLRTLPAHIGEARVVIMKNGTTYLSHADIDDRYHLSIRSDTSYLIDLTHNKMFPIEVDGTWYSMNAGVLHSAAVFGEHNRVQLVVRQLLTSHQLTDPVFVEIESHGENTRYRFDNTTSVWLNGANKRQIMTGFTVTPTGVSFYLESWYVSELRQSILPQFRIKIGETSEH